MSRRLQYILAALLIAAGGVLLSRPWWTGLLESSGQSELAQEYAQTAARAHAAGDAAAPLAPAAPAAVPHAAPAPGPWRPPGPPPPVFARLTIPAIGLADYVGDGATLTDYYGLLEWGPGHITGTPGPGGVGNVVIIGHRDEFGSPFWNLYRLRAGDTVRLQARGQTYDYRVQAVSTVDPTDVGVVAQLPAVRDLTLITCGGPGNSRRVVVRAALPPPPAAPRATAVASAAKAPATTPAGGVKPSGGTAQPTVTSSTYTQPKVAGPATTPAVAQPARSPGQPAKAPGTVPVPAGATAVAPPAPRSK